MWGSGRRTKRQLVDVRHQRAMDIRDRDVTVVNERQWRVASQGAGTGQGGYVIHLESPNCPQNSCREWNKCFADGCAGLCAHMYRCTCPDDNTLCKHIHKVRILNVRATQTPAQQAATSSADQRWRREENVGREVRKARSSLKEIGHYLERFNFDALEGVIGDAAEELGSIAARIFCHCEDYENAEYDNEEEAEEQEDGEEEEEEVEEEEEEGAEDEVDGENDDQDE